MNESKKKISGAVISFGIAAILYSIYCFAYGAQFYSWISAVLVPISCALLIYFDKLQFLSVSFTVYTLFQVGYAVKMVKFINEIRFEYTPKLSVLIKLISYGFILLGNILMIVYILIACKKGESSTNKLNKIWWIPGVLLVFAMISNMFSGMLGLGNYINFSLFGQIAFCVSMFLLGSQLTKPMNQREQFAADANVRELSSYMVEAGYCSMLLHVLLLLFTFGIGQLYWVYKLTRYLNLVSNYEKRTPICQLLLCMFVPFYSIYWIYQSSKRIDAFSQGLGAYSDTVTVNTILGIIVPVISFILMQNKVNEIVELHRSFQYNANNNFGTKSLYK